MGKKSKGLHEVVTPDLVWTIRFPRPLRAQCLHDCIEGVVHARLLRRAAALALAAERQAPAAAEHLLWFLNCWPVQPTETAPAARLYPPAILDLAVALSSTSVGEVEAAFHDETRHGQWAAWKDKFLGGLRDIQEAAPRLPQCKAPLGAWDMAHVLCSLCAMPAADRALVLEHCREPDGHDWTLEVKAILRLLPQEPPPQPIPWHAERWSSVVGPVCMARGRLAMRVKAGMALRLLHSGRPLLAHIFRGYDHFEPAWVKDIGAVTLAAQTRLFLSANDDMAAQVSPSPSPYDGCFGPGPASLDLEGRAGQPSQGSHTTPPASPASAPTTYLTSAAAQPLTTEELAALDMIAEECRLTLVPDTRLPDVGPCTGTGSRGSAEVAVGRGAAEAPCLGEEGEEPLGLRTG